MQTRSNSTKNTANDDDASIVVDVKSSRKRFNASSTAGTLASAVPRSTSAPRLPKSSRTSCSSTARISAPTTTSHPHPSLGTAERRSLQSVLGDYYQQFVPKSDCERTEIIRRGFQTFVRDVNTTNSKGVFSPSPWESDAPPAVSFEGAIRTFTDAVPKDRRHALEWYLSSGWASLMPGSGREREGKGVPNPLGPKARDEATQIVAEEIKALTNDDTHHTLSASRDLGALLEEYERVSRR